MKISLFPFLPVLLCMMGAMIMFLVLAAWNIQESATHPNAGTMTLEEAEELQYKIEASLEESDWYAENFAATQQKAEEQLADLHAKLALAEKETQKIKEELLRLQALAQQLDSQTSATPEEVEQLKNLLDQQQKRLADAELELAELRKEVAQQEKSYAIVPRRSTNGTFRRPIYIECRDNKIIIQPEGIELLPGDFQALGDPANPFDTVLRTVRQYYIETEQIARGSEPYPLLLVRPSGIEMYDTALQAAQQAAGNWMNAFGYELVNEDWNIHYPEPNEELRNRMTQQLATARNRLNGYLLAQRMAEPGMRYGSAMPEQFRMDHRGNVMPVSQGPWREPGPSPTDNPGSGGDASVSQSQSPWREPGASLTDNPGSAGDATVSQSQSPWREPGGPLTDNPGSGGDAHPSGDPQMQQPQQPQRQTQQRQQNWALKGATQFSTGISRSVRIRCEADRFVLSAQPGLRSEEAIDISGSAALAADRLVQAIWEFQESWGPAGENKYWRPILQVRVSPGGEYRLRELKEHLRTSGLVIEDD